MQAKRTPAANLARRYWRVAGYSFSQGSPNLLHRFIAKTWPLTPDGACWPGKTREREYRAVIIELPFALADEARAAGVPAADIVRTWADALDSQ